jgi:hypothetical protein
MRRFQGAIGAVAVCADVDRPLVSDDACQSVVLAVSLPQCVCIDQRVARSLAQAVQHKAHRGQLFS